MLVFSEQVFDLGMRPEERSGSGEVFLVKNTLLWIALSTAIVWMIGFGIVFYRWRRPMILKHQLTPLDLVRSLVFSIGGARKLDVAAVLFFLVIVLVRRRLPRWIGHALPMLRSGWIKYVIKRRSSWLTLGGILWFMHWRRFQCERPVVSCRRTFWNVAIVEKAGLAKREFRPVFWLTSRHAQTVIGSVLADLSFFFFKPKIIWKRQPLVTHDNGEIFLDWLKAPRAEFEPYGDGLTNFFHQGSSSNDIDTNQTQNLHCNEEEETESSSIPIALLMYGIGGTRDDHYMKSMALSCRSRGWRPVVLTYWRLDWYEWKDLDKAIHTIHSKYPLAPLFAIAHSASAHMLVQYLAAVGDNTPLVSAVTISGCLDMARAYDFVKHTKNRTYRAVFARGMRRCIRRHYAHDPTLTSPEQRARRAARLLKIKCGADIMYDRHVAALTKARGLPPRPPELDDDAMDIRDAQDPAFLTKRGRRTRPTTSDIDTEAETDDALSESPSSQDPSSQKKDAAQGKSRLRAFRRSKTVSLLDSTRLHYRTPARVMLGQVRVPMLLIHARDDPLVSHDDNLSWPEAVKNSYLITVRTHRGGHVAWFTDFAPIGPSWACGLCTDYISAVIEQTHQTGWLCAVFDKLHKNNTNRNGQINPSSIAKAAAAHDIVLPRAPSASTYFHSYFYEHDPTADNRSSRASSLVGSGATSAPDHFDAPSSPCSSGNSSFDDGDDLFLAQLYGNKYDVVDEDDDDDVDILGLVD